MLNNMNRTVEIEFTKTVFVAPGVNIPKGMKFNVITSNEFPQQWELEKKMSEIGLWKPEYKCGLSGTYVVVKNDRIVNKRSSERQSVTSENSSKMQKMSFVRIVLYYTIGLFIPFVFAKPIIQLLQSIFSLEGILWKSGEKNNSSPIDNISKFKRSLFGIVLPWWAIKLIFSKD